MNTDLERNLIECLDALERGESLADILRRYPQQAEELRPFLETAALLNDLNLQPSLHAQARSRQAFLAQADALRPQKPRLIGWRRWQRALVPVMAIVVLLFLISAALVPASAGAVPGDALYRFKRLGESVRLDTTASAEQKLELIETYKERRRQEILALLSANKDVDQVTFEGTIEALAADAWQVGSIPVQIAPSTQIEGRPEVGLLAIITGRVRQGSLLALTIFIPEGGGPVVEPTPSATATDTAVPTHTPSPTATGTLRPSATPSSSPTPSPTATPTLTPTHTPTATPTHTPTETAVPSPTLTNTPPPPPPPGDDSNDNSNDNGDDDHNDNDNDNDNHNDNGGDDHDNENQNSNLGT